MSELFDGCWGCAVLLGAATICGLALVLGQTFGLVGVIAAVLILWFMFSDGRR